MNIWWPSIAIGFLPLVTCYVTFPWFRAAVNRRLTFKPLDYDALDQILVNGLPERMTIECLQAKYKANQPEHSHVDIYPHKQGVAVIRMLVDEAFPIARIFHDVLSHNISALCMKSNKPPVIVINQSVYSVLNYEYDDTYLLIYIEHE